MSAVEEVKMKDEKYNSSMPEKTYLSKPKIDYRNLGLTEAIRTLKTPDEILEWKTYFVELVGQADFEYVKKNPEHAANIRILQRLGLIVLTDRRTYDAWMDALPELERIKRTMP